jgi:hypothetical protein
VFAHRLRQGDGVHSALDKALAGAQLERERHAVAAAAAARREQQLQCMVAEESTSRQAAHAQREHQWKAMHTQLHGLAERLAQKECALTQREKVRLSLGSDAAAACRETAQHPCAPHRC